VYVYAVGPVCAVAVWLVQPKIQAYSLGCTSVLTQLINCSLGMHESAI